VGAIARSAISTGVGHDERLAHGLEEADGNLPPPAEIAQIGLVEIAVRGGGDHEGICLLPHTHPLHEHRQDHKTDHYQHTKQDEHHLLVLAEYLEWTSHDNLPLRIGGPARRIRLDRRADVALMVSRPKRSPNLAILGPIDVNAIPKRVLA
jgi:hypothetical protein